MRKKLPDKDKKTKITLTIDEEIMKMFGFNLNLCWPETYFSLSIKKIYVSIR